MNTTKSLEEIMASVARQIKPQLVSDAEKETLEAERRKEERKDWAAQEYKKLEAPLRLRRQSDNLRHDGDWGSALGALKQKLGKGGVFVLRGPSGTGKSQMAHELCKFAILDKGMTARFTSFATIQLLLKSSFRDRSDTSEFDIIKGLLKPELLVIDEFDWCPLGDKTVTENYWQNIAYYIINERWGDAKDTILTSNKTAQEFDRETLATVKTRISQTGGIISTENWTNWRVR